MNNRNIYLSALSALVLAMVLTACQPGGNNPGIQYAPEMYTSLPLEPYTQVADTFSPFKDKLNAQVPPEGTIARGKYADYPYPNSEVDSLRHLPGIKNLYNPIRRTAKTMEEGEVLYLRFCGACHGPKGLGKGKVSEHPAINPQAYTAAGIVDYTQGEVYYAIMHGKGVMGSYSSQLTYEDRMKVLHYVETLQERVYNLEFDELSMQELYTTNLDDITGEPEYNLNVATGEAYWLSGVMFNRENELMLSTKGKKEVQKIADALKTFPDLVVEIQTHTFYQEGQTDSARAQQITQAQANMIASRISDMYNVPASRVRAIGKGVSEPVNTNLTEDHFTRNVRTEVHFIQTKSGELAKAEAAEMESEEEEMEDAGEEMEEGQEENS